LPDKGLLLEQVSQYPTLNIEDQYIGLLTGQFAHNRASPLLPGENQFNNAVIRYLTDIVDPRSLEMGSEKLAERRRCGRVDLGMGSEMNSSGVRFA
jgi:hypothetical protein